MVIIEIGKDLALAEYFKTSYQNSGNQQYWNRYAHEKGFCAGWESRDKQLKKIPREVIIPDPVKFPFDI